MRLVEEQTVQIGELKARELAVLKATRDEEEVTWERRRQEHHAELAGMEAALADCQSFMAQVRDVHRVET